ncbi:DUF4270 family protein [Mucilaginibacter sp.]|uniref:DUF4270 family protein n=1 Tax=Mucilaginibacter sp. TaxID=1882438 RepID=UPI0035BB9F3D
MKFSKLGLLTLLISLFILNSCKNQDSIGLGVDAGTQLNGTLIADTSVVVATMPDDTVATGALVNSSTTAGTPSKGVLAYFKDPDFGITETNIAAALNLPNGIAYTLPTGTITIDSSVLVLPYSDGFYGDSLTSRFKLDVHQLAEKVVLGTPYYNNKQFAFAPALLGTKTFTARTHDTIKVFNILKGRTDTLIKVAPQLRIPISQDFVNTYLLGADAATYRASLTAFQNGAKGIYLTLDKNGTTGPGGNIPFELDSARISVYYRANNAGVIDTAIVSMPVQTSAHAIQIKHTYTPKVLAAISSPATSGLVYLQGGAGLRAKVSFPNIKSIFAGLGSGVVINRAELVVKVAPGTNIPYRAPQRLTMYQLDIAKQRTSIPDGSITDPRGVNGTGAFGGFYIAATGEYHFTVTGYIQDLISGKAVDNGTFIAPVNPLSSSVDITPTAQYTERLITFGKNSPNRIKLNIIYTKINK